MIIRRQTTLSGTRRGIFAILALALVPVCLAPAVRAQDAAAAPAPDPNQKVRVDVRVLEWKLINSMDFDFAIDYRSLNPSAIASAADLTLPATSPLGNAARVFLDGLDAGNQGRATAVIEALESVGKVKTLVDSSITMKLGNEGEIKHGTKVPYAELKNFGLVAATTTAFRDTGISVNCKFDGVKHSEFIQLTVNAAVSDLTGFMNISKDSAGITSSVPVMDSRKITNQVILKDGEMFITGLLKSTREIERRRGIPFISEIPILQWFTSNVALDEEVIELVFLVRAELIKTEGPSAVAKQ